MSTLISESLTNLEEELVYEREWRVREIASIKKNLLPAYQDHSVIKNIISRMHILYLYAHWEGFCCSSFKIMYKFINSIGLNPLDSNRELLTFANSSSYNSLKGKHSFLQKCDFTEKFLKILYGCIRITSKPQTNSNVNFSTLEILLAELGMSKEPFEQYKSNLDKFVLIRNAIAHGEDSFIFPDVIMLSEYTSMVIELIDLLIVTNLSYIKSESYLRTITP